MKRPQLNLKQTDDLLKRGGIRAPMMRLVILGIVLAAAAMVPSSCNRLFPRGGSIDHLPPMEIYFSPHGGATDAVVQAIGAAQTTVLIQAYSFTSAPIAKALVDAHNRGVHVEAILDDSQKSEKYTSLDFLAHAGISTWIDARHAIAHNKVMILDGKVVITGSFNFTKAAEENNAENLLIIRDEAVAQQYTANWQRHAEHSEPYPGATIAPKPRSHRR